MSVGKVSFGRSGVQQQPEAKSSGLLKGTVIAAGTGAVINGGWNYLNQKSFIKNAGAIKQGIRENALTYIKVLRETLGDTAEAKRFITSIGRAAFNKIKCVNNIVKKGVNYKAVGKAGAVGAVIVGGGYLVYRGIKALFTSKKA